MRWRDPRIVVLGLGLLGVALAIAGAVRPPKLVVNTSASAPIGLWRILDRPWRVGDWVAVRPDQRMVQALRESGVRRTDRLLVKKVAAAAGDLVCRSGLEVSINGQIVATARVTALNSAALPVWSGCRRLTTTEVFLLNPAPGSFDGRYFGPTARALVIGPMALVHARLSD